MEKRSEIKQHSPADGTKIMTGDVLIYQTQDLESDV